jgi:hypothetical protein
MFKSIRRILTTATVIITVSAPSAAYARFFEYSPPAGSQTNSQAQPSLTQLGAAKQRQLDQLQASVAQRVASHGGWPTATTTAHPTGQSSQDAFHWGDAGIGAAGVLALVSIGAGATLLIRRRMHQPLAS